MPAAEPKIWPCSRNSQAPRIQELAPEPPGRPCLRSLTTLISLPTQSPSPGRLAPQIPLPGRTWTSVARMRNAISHFPAVGKVVQVVVPDKVADPEAVVR